MEASEWYYLREYHIRTFYQQAISQ
jgi:hypothetical protein